MDSNDNEGRVMLNLWNTQRLADDIAADRLTSRQKGTYYVFIAVLYMALTYVSNAGSSHYTWMYLYEGIVVCVVTFVGARRVVSAYPEPLDAKFFEAAFLVSIPLSIKAVLVLWIGDYGAWWLLDMALERNAMLDDPSRAVNYWGRRLYDLVPFVLAAAVAVVYWLRLAHHVGYVAGKRNEV
jgi:hypothetical protein